MSRDYLVFCRARPQLAPGEVPIGPVAVSPPRRRRESDRWAIAMLPAEARTNVGDWVVALDCRSAAAEVADYLGELIAGRSGGGWIVCDAGDEALEVAAGTRAKAEMTGELRQLVEDLLRQMDAFDAQQLQRAAAAYEYARLQDPAGHAEADDWSDV